MQKIDGTRAFDTFGYSVAMAGDHVIVSSYGDDDNGSSAGAVYVYERTESGWREVQKLVASDGADGDQFGYSVATTENYAIIGAWRAEDDDSGAAYVFERRGNGWSEVQKLISPDEGRDRTRHQFGESVAISDDHAIVGVWRDADREEYKGAAHVFERTADGWGHVGRLTVVDDFNRFGWSVTMTEDYAVVGAPQGGDNGADSGSAYIWRYR